jgi:glycosyltransferase involved in cell wall biosynthesis
LWLLLLLRLKGASLLYSPHTLFSRHGGAFESLLFDLCIRVGGKIVVYNEADYAELLRRKIATTLAPLAMYVPPLRPEVVLKWQEYASTHRITVCSVGQLRADKNLPLLVRACAEAGQRVLIAGKDAGALAEVSHESALHPGVAHVIEEYLEMDDLAAILYVVGVVALPYSVASQSAVAVLARAFGCTTIAYEVGGLVSQADITIPTLDPGDWAAALRSAGDRRRLSTKQVDLPGSDPELARILRAVVDPS